MVFAATEEYPYNSYRSNNQEHRQHSSTVKQQQQQQQQLQQNLQFSPNESRYARTELITNLIEKAKSAPFLSPFSSFVFHRNKTDRFGYEISATSSNESLPSTISSHNSPTSMDMTTDPYYDRSMMRGSFELPSPGAYYGPIIPIGVNETSDSYEYFSQHPELQSPYLGIQGGYGKRSQSPRSPPGIYLGGGSPLDRNNDFDSIPYDSMKQKLMESLDVIAQLNWRVEQMTKETDKNRQSISTLNNVLTSKDIELRETRTLANRIRENMTTHLLAKEREINAFRALINKDGGSENLRKLMEGFGGLDLDLENLSALEKPSTRTAVTMTDFKLDDAAVETAQLVVECEDLKAQLAKALQEAENCKIEVSVRDKEISNLKAEMRSLTSMSANNLSPAVERMADVTAMPFNGSQSTSSHSSFLPHTNPDIAATSPSNDGFSLADDDTSVSCPSVSSYRGGWAGSEHRRGSISSLSSTSFNRPQSANSGSFSQQDYRRLVDKIIQQTDQQASIFLQQKLKTGPQDQKDAVFKAILAQAYPLMTNRFGNFLVQKCFELGTRAQVKTIAGAMRGNVLTLACDPFGCHVVQKALDIVDEDLKATFVSELFRKIPETITHRHACHVWQKIFELQWSCAPPAVMMYVNNALTGKWNTVALDETGSLVVQNIFENVPEADKRPVIEEVLINIVSIARGQWGNWVIQHLLEHGAANVRAKVLQTILDEASLMSMDQFASKVIEKALRSGGVDVMAAYVKKVSQSPHDKPRCSLIDIASDQYGNYIIQNLLSNAPPDLRENVVKLIRRHMVSLRGSKYGQKVACMIEKGNDAGAESYHQSHAQRRNGNYSRKENGYVSASH